jgi:hypothetical protein
MQAVIIKAPRGICLHHDLPNRAFAGARGRNRAGKTNREARVKNIDINYILINFLTLRKIRGDKKTNAAKNH